MVVEVAAEVVTEEKDLRAFLLFPVGLLEIQ